MVAKGGLPAYSNGTTPVYALALNPSQTSTLYAGTDFGFFISTDGADSWKATPLDFYTPVKSIAVDPITPSFIYGTISEYDYFFGDFIRDTVVKSEDGGVSWTEGVNFGIRGYGTTVLTIDPSQPTTLYLGTSSGVFRSTDRASSWSPTKLQGNQAWAVAVAPGADASVPSTVYAGNAVGIFKSIDGGVNWVPAMNGLAMRFILALAVDPNDPATVIAGGILPSAAFVTRLSASGAQMEYSTYLGGNGNDVGLAVALDANGRAVVVGRTDSTTLATISPLQATAAGSTDAFVAHLRPDGSALSFATYFGGSGADEARGVAVDSAGSIYLAGDTASPDFPRAVPFQQNPGDLRFVHGFVSKIAASPVAGASVGAVTTVAAQLNVTGSRHATARLRDGRGLIAGGLTSDPPAALDSAEIYDPASGTFIPAGRMTAGLLTVHDPSRQRPSTVGRRHDRNYRGALNLMSRAFLADPGIHFIRRF